MRLFSWLLIFPKKSAWILAGFFWLIYSVAEHRMLVLSNGFSHVFSAVKDCFLWDFSFFSQQAQPVWRHE